MTRLCAPGSLTRDPDSGRRNYAVALSLARILARKGPFTGFSLQIMPLARRLLKRVRQFGFLPGHLARLSHALKS